MCGTAVGLPHLNREGGMSKMAQILTIHSDAHENTRCDERRGEFGVRMTDGMMTERCPGEERSRAVMALTTFGPMRRAAGVEAALDLSCSL